MMPRSAEHEVTFHSEAAGTAPRSDRGVVDSSHLRLAASSAKATESTRSDCDLSRDVQLAAPNRRKTTESLGPTPIDSEHGIDSGVCVGCRTRWARYG
jgi:hypothetical protein